jgi:hypothetical protein
MPTRVTTTLAALVVLASSVVGCAPSLRGTVDHERLRVIVERDAVLFEPTTIPEPMLDALSGHRIVLVGEVHDITHHDAFVGELAAALRPRGFRTLLLEFPQAESWLLDGYALGAIDALLPGAERTYGPLLDRIRAANAALPAGERIRVRAIDVNPRLDDFLPPFRGLLHQVGHPEPLVRLVVALEGGDDPNGAMATARAEVAIPRPGATALRRRRRSRRRGALRQRQVHARRYRARRGPRGRDARHGRPSTRGGPPVFLSTSACTTPRRRGRTAASTCGWPSGWLRPAPTPCSRSR